MHFIALKSKAAISLHLNQNGIPEFIIESNKIQWTKTTFVFEHSPQCLINACKTSAGEGCASIIQYQGFQALNVHSKQYRHGYRGKLRGSVVSRRKSCNSHHPNHLEGEKTYDALSLALEEIAFSQFIFNFTAGFLNVQIIVFEFEHSPLTKFSNES
ncbi:hypothetical protein EGR_03967 [Echinococcus granulosus]|uniref:Uncharacterized protein n=1 Tax=Echinococcus granulosus TaxID=6210 RepID=W6V4M6_ECHGR|nr:hypothetical protein EGR_03967 [Echinococcus granulosus]EUB61119.1 hypothetical protein EGR_03967 [Echinococcus granulosus]